MSTHVSEIKKLIEIREPKVKTGTFRNLRQRRTGLRCEMRPEQWIVSDDTGTSSIAIWSHMMGVDCTGRWGNGTPSDPSDFGRCYRLLEKFPGWKPRMTEMSEKYPHWKDLVDNWDECERLYLRDKPTGKSEELYQLMTKLRR